MCVGLGLACLHPAPCPPAGRSPACWLVFVVQSEPLIDVAGSATLPKVVLALNTLVDRLKLVYKAFQVCLNACAYVNVNQLRLRFSNATRNPECGCVLSVMLLLCP